MRALIAITLSLALGGPACSRTSSIESRKRSGPGSKVELERPEITIEALSALAAKPGEVIAVRGQNFRSGMTAVIAGIEVELTVTSATTATFVMPGGVDTGLVEISFAMATDTLGTLRLISDASNDELPIMLIAPELVCNDIRYRDARGEVKKGLRDCANAALALCKAEGEVGCRTHDAAKATLVRNLAAKVVVGAEVAGVQGTVPVRPADCGADGSSACVVDGVAYKAARMANAVAADIRTGVTLGGIQGSYTAPSPCDADGGTDCVASATFRAAATADLAAKVLDGETVAGIAGNVTLPDAGDVRDGIDYGAGGASLAGSLEVAPACADDGDQNCVVSGVLRAANVTGVSPWDLRVGKALGGIEGRVKNCRNTARSVTATILYDAITAPAVAGLDFFDTIDEFNAGAATLPPDRPFGTDYACGASNWTDLTTDGACNSAGDQCMFLDRITGLTWSESSHTMNFSGIAAAAWPCGSAGCTQTNGVVTADGGSGAYAAGATLRWYDALHACDTLDFGGHQDWRLPTQKELMQAYIDGIRDVRSAHFVNVDATYLSSTTFTAGLGSFLAVHMARGTSSDYNKASSPMAFACVRGG